MDLPRPWTIYLAALAMSIPILVRIALSPQIGTLLIFLPALYVVYGVWRGDNIARWFATCLLLILIGSNVYSFWIMANYEPPEESIISGTTNTAAIIKQAMTPKWHHYAALAAFLVSLVCLHVPASKNYFTRDS